MDAAVTPQWTKSTKISLWGGKSHESLPYWYSILLGYSCLYTLSRGNKLQHVASLIPRSLPTWEKGLVSTACACINWTIKKLVIELLPRNMRTCSKLRYSLHAWQLRSYVVFRPLVCPDMHVFVNSLPIVWWDTGVLAISLHVPSFRPIHVKFCRPYM